MNIITKAIKGEISYLKVDVFDLVLCGWNYEVLMDMPIEEVHEYIEIMRTKQSLGMLEGVGFKHRSKRRDAYPEE